MATPFRPTDRFQAFSRPAIADLLSERHDLRELLQDFADENQALRARVAAQAAEINTLKQQTRETW